MKTNLPRLSQDDMKHIETRDYLVTDAWLSRIQPFVPWTAFQCFAVSWSLGGATIFFEISHTEMWNGEMTTFRTGTVRVRFNSVGEAHDIWWESNPINRNHEGLPCRPLWLWGQFWDAIPMSVKLDDPEYARDPFDGFADFKALDGFGYEGMF